MKFKNFKKQEAFPPRSIYNTSCKNFSGSYYPLNYSNLRDGDLVKVPRARGSMWGGRRRRRTWRRR